MNYEELLTEFFYTFKSETNKQIPKGIHTNDFLTLLCHKILYAFGLPINSGYEDILLDFVNNDQIAPGLIESVIYLLKQNGKEYALNHQNVELSDLPRSLKNRSPFVIAEMKEYVTSHLNFRLTNEEFAQIEIGFRLFWNAATGIIISNRDIEHWVNQYLISVEFRVDPYKVKRVVELILEYIEEIGRRG